MILGLFELLILFLVPKCVYCRYLGVSFCCVVLVFLLILEIEVLVWMGEAQGEWRIQPTTMGVFLQLL